MIYIPFCLLLATVVSAATSFEPTICEYYYKNRPLLLEPINKWQDVIRAACVPPKDLKDPGYNGVNVSALERTSTHHPLTHTEYQYLADVAVLLTLALAFTHSSY